MIDENAARREDIATVYRELCSSYRAIDDFRAKLLGFLPLASGAGIFLLVSGDIGDRNEHFLTPVGVFGMLVTLGLFAYEIYGIKRCGALIEAGVRLECSLKVRDGQFRQRPRQVAGLINEPVAAAIIYPAVLAAWMYLALAFLSREVAFGAAVLVFVAFCACAVMYELSLRTTARERADDADRIHDA